MVVHVADGRAGKQVWPGPGSKFWLVQLILALILALGQGLNALEATKTTSVVVHVVLCLICLTASAFYFLNWRKGREPNGPEAD